MDRRKLLLSLAGVLLTAGYGLYWFLGETPPAPPPLPPPPWTDGQEFEVKYPEPTNQPMGWIPPVEQSPAVVAMGKKAAGEIPTYVRVAQGGAAPIVKKNLSDDAKAVLGGHIPTRKQEVGDCVSQGAANAIDYLKCSQWARGPPAGRKFSPTFAPFLYGVSRVQILGNQLGNGDGSTGWAGFEAARKYGSLDSDAPDCPPYSGAIARAWGRRPGVPERFFDLAREHKVTGARVTCYADVADSILNGWPVTVASGQGFTRCKISDGRLWGLPIGRWPHQMCFIGVDTTIHCPVEAGGGVGACVCINSWGPDAHGPCPDGCPPGSFWVSSRIVEKMVAEGDSYSYQTVAGFGKKAKDCPEDGKVDGGAWRIGRSLAVISRLCVSLPLPINDCPDGKCNRPKPAEAPPVPRMTPNVPPNCIHVAGPPTRVVVTRWSETRRRLDGWPRHRRRSVHRIRGTWRLESFPVCAPAPARS